MAARILLLNPWIHDFSAFDLWLRPLNLYRLASVLRKAGLEVSLFDCLNRRHPAVLEKKGRHRKDKAYGCGHFYRDVIAKPESVSFVPRNYRRYGVPFEAVAAELRDGPSPDAVVVACMMTYWYPAAREAIDLCRTVWPQVPIYLGGVYPDLLPEYAAEHSGADRIFSRQDYGAIATAIGDDLGDSVDVSAYRVGRGYIRPAYDLAWTQQSLPILTSRGCPFRCTYCVSPLLNPRFEQYAVDDVVDEVVECVQRFGTEDFAFYDDALLVGGVDHLARILEGILSLAVKVRFHVPNALHAALITPELARLLYRAGFRTIRLGLEFVDQERQAATGGKVDSAAYRRAVGALREAGFTPRDVGTYIMLGYPGQDLGEVRTAARLVCEAGSHIRLVMYAPIPGSADWKKGFDDFIFDPREDPLLTNNSLAPYRSRVYTTREYLELKREVNRMNEGLVT
jgi:molybdenum cofactor biosynthesis enzyme MoaA